MTKNKTATAIALSLTPTIIISLGPCRAASLAPIAVTERDGAVWLADSLAVVVK